MTAFAIKLIAIITMIVDHAGLMFGLHIGFRVVGRLAFPLFVFLIAESCRHTKSLEKFLLRLGIFALVSEIPFDLAFNESLNFLNNTNIFYTLWLGVFCVYGFKRLQSRRYLWLLTPLLLLAAMGAAEWLGADYGGIGVLFIFLTAAASGYKYAQLLVMAAFCIYLYFPPAPVSMMLAALLTLPIVALANGRRGRAVKWPFYLIYPGHLLLFALTALVFL